MPEGQASLDAAVYERFRASGGSHGLPELLDGLSAYGVEERTLTKLLRESGRYFRGLPIPGYKREWFLTDAERLLVPLPGNMQLLELKVMQLRDGGRGVTNLAPQLEFFRQRVGAAIRQAREIRGIEIPELAGIPDVLEHFSRCFESAMVRPAHPALGDLWRTVSEWWDWESTEGAREGITTAWRYVEGSETDTPFLLAVIDVRCWDALSAALKVDSASLSRGLVRGRSG